ncbi:MAG: FtsX-like permease family protein [Acidobacteria bacterium]|nr:FtsX-like permease family protein [Acidobacteriota bacterium]
MTFSTLALLEPEWQFRAPNEIWLRVIVRVQNDISVPAAESVLQAAGSRIASGAPPQFASALRLVPASSPLFDPTVRAASSRLALLVAGEAALVLLIACANVATLLVVRAASRRRELGVRLAIGASRGRVARPMVTESLVLGAAGCAAALLVANWTIEAVTALAPASVIPPGVTIALDWRIGMFAAGLSFGVALLCGLLTAWQVSRVDLLPVVKGTTPNDASAGMGMLSLRRGLVVVQVALSAVLLVGAGLFIRTLGAALSVAPGYDINRVLLTTVDFGAAGMTPPAVPATGERILNEVRAISGVDAAAFGHIVPFSGAFVARPAAPESEPMSADDADRFLVPYAVVSHAYFQTLGMTSRGRDFTTADGPQAPPVMIINETLAQRHWPGQDALGKRMRLAAAPGPLYEVIGVVPDGKYVSLTEAQHPYMYLPWGQSPVHA